MLIFLSFLYEMEKTSLLDFFLLRICLDFLLTLSFSQSLYNCLYLYFLVQVRAGIVGYPNVGKSSLINRLLKRRMCPAAPRPGVTRELKYVNFVI